jgi:hypothetical protein
MVREEKVAKERKRPSPARPIPYGSRFHNFPLDLAKQSLLSPSSLTTTYASLNHPRQLKSDRTTLPQHLKSFQGWE